QHFVALFLDALALDEYGAAARFNKARKHLYRRRFAGAIGSEKTEDLTGTDAEIDVIDGVNGAPVIEMTLVFSGPFGQKMMGIERLVDVLKPYPIVLAHAPPGRIAYCASI